MRVINMKKAILSITLIVVSIGLLSCAGNKQPTQMDSSITAKQNPTLQTTAEQMVVTTVDPNIAYPLGEGTTDPNKTYPTGSVEAQGIGELSPGFTLVEPLSAGQTIVTGTGVPNLPLILLNLSMVDEVIGKTVADANGDFSFTLTTPLMAGETVGLKIGDITNTEFNPSDFLNNPTYYDRPYVGILFYIAYVK